MQGLAETLLTLDMPGRICGADMKPGARVKLSPLGCAMLTTLLSFPQVHANAFYRIHDRSTPGWYCGCCHWDDGTGKLNRRFGGRQE